MGAFLCSMSDVLCFGDAKDNKYKNDWVKQYGTVQRRNEQAPLVGSGRRYTKKRIPNKRKRTLRQKRQ